jgi:mRNA-degrading endonuclease toxin of MazEF toxin-antitoxin module
LRFHLDDLGNPTASCRACTTSDGVALWREISPGADSDGRSDFAEIRILTESRLEKRLDLAAQISA